MPLTPDKIAALDNYFAAQQQPDQRDYMTQLTEPKSGLTPEKIAILDAHFGKQVNNVPKEEVGIGRTAFDQSMQGATFGFGDEISNALGAFGAKVYSTAYAPELTAGKSVGDLYSEAANISKRRLDAEIEQNPGTSIAANIAGGLVTGGPKVLSSALTTGSLPARIIKGGLAGAATGGLYGAGTAEDGTRLEGAKTGAEVGALIGGTVPAAGAVLGDIYNTGKNMAIGAFAKSPEAVQNAASSMKGSAGGIYDQMRNIGATIKQSAVDNFLLPDIDAALTKHKFIANLNPKTVAIIDDMKQQAASQGGLGLDELDQYRRLLGRVGNSEDGVSAGAVKKSIDDYVNSISPNHLSNGSRDAVDLLNQGRRQYAQASKFQEVSDVLVKADGDPNKIKAGLTRFLQNSENTKGFSPSELAALKDAARGSGMEKLLKMGGKFGFDLGNSTTMGNTLTPIIGGYATGNPLVPVAGTIARQGQKYAARGKAQNLLNVIETGSSSTKRMPINPLLISNGSTLATQNFANKDRKKAK